MTEFFNVLLRDSRVDAGLSQSALSVAIGVSANAIWEWERYDRVPRLDVILRVAPMLEATLGVEAALFVESREYTRNARPYPTMRGTFRYGGFCRRGLHKLVEGRGWCRVCKLENQRRSSLVITVAVDPNFELKSIGTGAMRYPCCQHCRDFGRRIGMFGPLDEDHENHQSPCYTFGCPGGEPK